MIKRTIYDVKVDPDTEYEIPADFDRNAMIQSLKQYALRTRRNPGHQM